MTLADSDKRLKRIPDNDKDTMKVKGICGDFYFRFMNVFKKNNILFDRDTTNQHAPNIRNPQM